MLASIEPMIQPLVDKLLPLIHQNASQVSQALDELEMVGVGAHEQWPGELRKRMPQFRRRVLAFREALALREERLDPEPLGLALCVLWALSEDEPARRLEEERLRVEGEVS